MPQGPQRQTDLVVEDIDFARSIEYEPDGLYDISGARWQLAPHGDAAHLQNP